MGERESKKGESDKFFPGYAKRLTSWRCNWALEIKIISAQHQTLILKWKPVAVAKSYSNTDAAIPHYFFDFALGVLLYSEIWQQHIS